MSDSKFDAAESILSMAIMKAGDSLTSELLKKLVYGDFREVLTGDYGGNLTEDDFPKLVDLLETKYNTTMGIGEVLVDTKVPHDEEWYSKRDIDFNYWNDYEKLLVSEGWPTNVVGAMNSVTDKILGLLPDPKKEGEWYRRGLVLGHVQSGKTANYIGVISKAADAGYKFIIVIAGIHNNLRKQTQQRIEEGFIGRDSDSKELVGVSLISPNREIPVSVTTKDSDFDRKKEREFLFKLDDFNKTFVLVIKKNVFTLSALYNWLKKLNTTRGYERISDIPMLMVDDEADNASVNTNKPELDPTRTNKELRNILALFKKRTYVGYTATPFANIFINPDLTDKVHGDDLFPRDFIYCLDAPTNYFGSEKIFLDDEKVNEIVKNIKDAHLCLPQKQKKGEEVKCLPDSLIEAIYLFLLARTIRNLRGQDDKHCSMLINVHIVTDIQREIKYLVDDVLRNLKNRVRFNCMKTLDQAENDEVISKLKDLFNEEYFASGFEWEEVLPATGIAVESIRTYMINSQSDDSLDYSGEPLSPITIGGLSLSRGLTVEGLTVSYIYRNSKMYDTLLQMGRWFGYRQGYEDLCRIFMTEESLGWYTHISEVTEELRYQLKRMRRDKKDPIDFGLQVRAHPDTLIVTAINKMRHAESRVFEMSFSGTLTETFILPVSPEKIQSNTTELEKLFSKLNTSTVETIKDKTNSHCFYDIKAELVEEFVRKFNFHSSMIELSEVMPDFINKIKSIHPKWDILFKSTNKAETSEFCIGVQERTIGYKDGEIKKPDLEEGFFTGSKQRFSGATMYAIGLKPGQIDEAKVFALQHPPRKNPIHTDFTNARGKPVLLLHYLRLVNLQKEIVLDRVPALSICFPSSTEYVTVEYVVNTVWLKQMSFEQEDFEEDFEDE